METNIKLFHNNYYFLNIYFYLEKLILYKLNNRLLLFLYKNKINFI
jgi:hypothetical protein